MANSATSTVKLLYVDEDQCFIELENPDVVPLDGYFRLKTTHKNYQSLYALVVSALVNNLTVTIRVDDEISSSSIPTVLYIVAST
jgi:hypothetical protein